MIHISDIIKLKSFKEKTNKKTQLEYYTENNADPSILTLIELNNKKFGEKIQKNVIDLFDLSKATDTSHDMTFKHFKIECKGCRFWTLLKDWKWQHITIEKEFDYIILVGVNFQGYNIFIISMKDVLKLIDQNLITLQGKQKGQGYWCEYKKIKDYLTELDTIDDFNYYMKNN